MVTRSQLGSEGRWNEYGSQKTFRSGRRRSGSGASSERLSGTCAGPDDVAPAILRGVGQAFWSAPDRGCPDAPAEGLTEFPVSRAVEDGGIDPGFEFFGGRGAYRVHQENRVIQFVREGKARQHLRVGETVSFRGHGADRA